MNKLFIIGNLTRDPEMRYTQDGLAVCNFTLAVNGRRQDDEAQYFRVSAWRQLGENCAKYLAKGRKAIVTGPVSARTYQTNDGTTRVSLEVTAQEVEFLSPRSEADQGGMPAQDPTPARAPQPPKQQRMDFTPVETEELPF